MFIREECFENADQTFQFIQTETGRYIMKSNIRIADSTGGKLLMAGLFLLLMFALTIPVQASPPGWADRGNKGEPPGWSQVNPGAVAAMAPLRVLTAIVRISLIAQGHGQIPPDHRDGHIRIPARVVAMVLPRVLRVPGE